ncbi:alpha/beta hydrolase [Leuconostoc litchii]|uniref:Alpha/beta hydrolase n=1 Tax=Leuconostoc litchii TaxID=1981069 RepID=A0A6P2CPF4_9LACO|nr:alpha/beta hydrolase [Leuconostoc litchii]TYC46082.1 alpha/beta hydrolase [Leuconostoc litchii]GMA69838.1 alpha/beta hydrolase [Leuconostoc litchii]
MYKNYTNQEQFDFQINRFMEPYKYDENVQQVIARVSSSIVNLESWYFEWFKAARKAENNEQFGLASAFYQLADFYLLENDSRKKQTYDLFKKNYYNSISMANIDLVNVPYKNGYLPAAVFKNEHATQTLIVHGGFDSYLEELIRLMISYDFVNQLTSYQIILFEGPGQGKALRTGLPLISEWEKPVGTILDYFNLENADLMGMSLGGFLSARAAAFEPRIKRVILYDVMLNMSESLTMKVPYIRQYFGKKLDKHEQQLLEEKLTLIQNNDHNINFLVKKAKDILKVESASDLLQKLGEFNMDGNWDKIEQDVLLIGGTNDMYVPKDTLAKEMLLMKNARSLTSKLFTKKSGGEHHCQVGDKELVMPFIIQFLQS